MSMKGRKKRLKEGKDQIKCLTCVIKSNSLGLFMDLKRDSFFKKINKNKISKSIHRSAKAFKCELASTSVSSITQMAHTVCLGPIFLWKLSISLKTLKKGDIWHSIKELLWQKWSQRGGKLVDISQHETKSRNIGITWMMVMVQCCSSELLTVTPAENF